MLARRKRSLNAARLLVTNLAPPTADRFFAKTAGFFCSLSLSGQPDFADDFLEDGIGSDGIHPR